MYGKILVIDDEKDVVKVLVARLTEQGYEVSFAFNGEGAFIEIERNKPDLIILDIMLPGMGGNEIAGKLREKPATRKIPIIFLSALQRKEEEKEQDGIVGGNVILAKPFDLDVLLKKIREKIL